MEDWPDTPFEESMLDKPIIVLCDSRESLDELLQVAERYGFETTGTIRSRWDVYKEHSCFRFDPYRRIVTYSSKNCYLGAPLYKDYIKCTFYGERQLPEISESCFESILTAGG